MKNYIIILLFCTSILSCKREQEDYSLRGRVFLKEFNTNTEKPITHGSVMLFDKSDSVNYLYVDSVDRDGYFEFTLVAKNEGQYSLKYEDSLNGINYKADLDLKESTNNIKLVAEIDTAKHNGLILNVVDSINKEPLPGSTVYIYNNLLLANKNNANGEGSIFSLKTNAYGQLVKTNIQPGVYYINASLKADTVMYSKVAEKVIINPVGLIIHTIALN